MKSPKKKSSKKPPKVRIGAITKEVLQADNSEFLSVQFDILEDGETLQTRRLGFPLDTLPEEIEVEVKNVAETYFADLALAERNKEHEQLHKQADETIEQLINKEI